MACRWRVDGADIDHKRYVGESLPVPWASRHVWLGARLRPYLPLSSAQMAVLEENIFAAAIDSEAERA